MICPSCGKEGRGRFCTNCGARLEAADRVSQDEPSLPDVQVTAVVPPGGFTDLEMRDESQGRPQPPQTDAASTQQVSPSRQEIEPRERPSYTPPPGVENHAEGASSSWTRPTGWTGTADQFSPAAGGVGREGVAAMGPMTLGQVVSGTFDIVRAHAMRFLGVAAAYTVAMFVAFFVFGLALAAAGVTSVLTGDITSLGAAIVPFFLGGLVLLAVAVVAGAVAACAYINISRGAEPLPGDDLVGSTVDTLRRAWADSPRLLLALLLLVGIWIVASILVGVIAVVFAQISGALAFLVYLCWLVVAVWLGVSLIFVPQAAVLDRTDPVGSLRESMQLVSGYWWRTFGFLIVAWLIGVGIYIAGFIVLAILSIVLSHIPVLGGLISALLYAGIFALFYAFYITYGTLMFYDLKARKAGIAPEVAPA